MRTLLDITALGVRRLDQEIVGHPAFAGQMPPDLAVGVDRRAVDIDGSLIREAADNLTFGARLAAYVGAAAAADADEVQRARNRARRLRAGGVDEMPFRAILEEINPAAGAAAALRTARAAMEPTGVDADVAVGAIGIQALLLGGARVGIAEMEVGFGRFLAGLDHGGELIRGGRPALRDLARRQQRCGGRRRPGYRAGWRL